MTVGLSKPKKVTYPATKNYTRLLAYPKTAHHLSQSIGVLKLHLSLAGDASGIRV